MTRTYHTAVFAKTNPAEVHLTSVNDGYPMSNAHPECGTHNRIGPRSIDQRPVTCEKCLAIMAGRTVEELTARNHEIFA